jgi:signal transduction histidine kinase
VSPSLDGVELRRELSYKGPVHCAEPLIAQVLTNLVQNGAHAAGRGGWVEVRTGLEQDRVVVEVRDSGPGVPEALKERIFEPFFTTKPAGSGTGLGLSTARDIVLRHGGTLDVRSSAGRTVFRLEIPQPS